MPEQTAVKKKRKKTVKEKPEKEEKAPKQLTREELEALREKLQKRYHS